MKRKNIAFPRLLLRHHSRISFREQTIRVKTTSLLEITRIGRSTSSLDGEEKKKRRRRQKKAVFHRSFVRSPRETCRRKDLAERTKVTWTLAKRCPFNPKRRHLKSLLRICRVDWQIEANNVAWPRVERRKSWKEKLGGGEEVDGWWGREKKRRWKRQSLVERRVINSD